MAASLSQKVSNMLGMSTTPALTIWVRGAESPRASAGEVLAFQRAFGAHSGVTVRAIELVSAFQLETASNPRYIVVCAHTSTATKPRNCLPGYACAHVNVDPSHAFRKGSSQYAVELSTMAVRDLVNAARLNAVQMKQAFDLQQALSHAKALLAALRLTSSSFVSAATEDAYVVGATTNPTFLVVPTKKDRAASLEAAMRSLYPGAQTTGDAVATIALHDQPITATNRIPGALNISIILPTSSRLSTDVIAAQIRSALLEAAAPTAAPYANLSSTLDAIDSLADELAIDFGALDVDSTTTTAGRSTGVRITDGAATESDDDDDGSGDDNDDLDE